ncbi:enoyl-CoA-hydratase DpgB [Streptomyces sp. NPDC093260]|uniref:enoyl-CoA-hydratase DpgB n=1 Tax=Streptomyces sp. NPDC093260 TaxID=3155073 RepID=UPI0034160041
MQTTPRLAEPSYGSGPVATIDLTRPLAELTGVVNSVCDRAESHPEPAPVILEFGDPRHTPSPDWPGAIDIQAVNRWERAVRRLERLTAVTVVAARGTCRGPALDLLLATDVRIGATGLRLELPVNDGHIWPGMSLYRLVRHLGLGQARRLVLGDAALSARRACELGLLDQVDDDVHGAVRAATARLGRLSGREITVRRQLLLEAATAEYDDALGLHLAACDRELRRLRQSGAPTAPEPAGRSRA